MKFFAQPEMILHVVFCAFVAVVPVHAQTLLEADGVTGTYELIESVLGSGTADETPDCAHPEFGSHITQSWDDSLGKYVFSFFIHVTPDNDRCLSYITDRQRNEIKIFGSSPDYLKGFYGDSCTYRWYFKIDSGFQPSVNFTHIHQIKAADGNDADMPLITITPRYAVPEQMAIIYTAPTAFGGTSTNLTTADLTDFKGQWIEASQRIVYATNGTYELVLKRVSDGAVLLSCTSSNLNMWRGTATFNRPKWGIYRSTASASYLRDEEVRFADFSFAKGSDTISNIPPSITQEPASRAVVIGQNAIFTAAAVGSAPLRYQWRFNTTNKLAGATNATLTVPNIQSLNEGGYSVVVTNAYGAVTSSVATLTMVFASRNVYSVPGVHTWICPDNVTSVQVECWGGGGAGGSAVRPVSPGIGTGGGGAGGAYARDHSYSVTPGNTYYINVGAGGASSTTDGDMVPGGDSWFNSVNGASTVILAKGGAGGKSVVASGAGKYGAGGAGSLPGSLGDIVYAGGGGATSTGNNYGGGGGSSGGSDRTGNSATADTGLGATAVNGGGNGGNANPVSGSSGSGQTPTTLPGGGGGGARSGSTAQQTGGAGADGQVILIYTLELAAGFSASPTNGGAPLIVTFTDTSTGAITNRYWNFGDGTTMNVTTTCLTHTYSFPGTNPVTLIVSDANGSSTHVKTNLIIATSVDTVGDGVPDWWRAQYFGGNGATTNAASNATADFDGDGRNNLEEYLADTVPTNGASRLELVRLMIEANDVRLIWIGGSSAWQSVEHRNSLTDTNGWRAFYTNTPPTAVTNTLFDTGAGSITSRFYRINAWR